MIEITKVFQNTDEINAYLFNGTVFHDRSTILVFQPMSFTQEICIAKQFCEQYGANAVLVKPFGIANLYEVWLKEYMNF